MPGSGRIQAIDRAVMILDCFTERKPQMRLSEIIDILDLNKSTLHGIISTLKYHGLIDQDEFTQEYKLGLKLIEYGQRVLDSMYISSIAKPIIERVCDELEETVHIGTLDGEEVVYIEKRESQQSMRIFTTIGARNPAHTTGVGKAMMAYLDENELNNILSGTLVRLTPKTISDKNQLKLELSQIRHRGFAFDIEENNLGLTCVAAPIFDHNGKALYGISVSGPTMRMNSNKLTKASRIVKDAADEISRKLGYKG
ncbi:MAG: IclR family transcriptional regulator [Clostridiales bacterium 38_11]|nr:MAG: IclR family transcriptional regulator [Clostridiales bacterium 38_11]HBH13076.1 IclR family transcriptional regulator [Clostridiales bacterium]